MFLQHVQQYPEQPYLHQPSEGQNTVLSWAEVERQARLIAQMIKDEDLPKRSHITERLLVEIGSSCAGGQI